MAFAIANFQPIGGQSKVGNCPQVLSYLSTADALAAIIASGYFDGVDEALRAKDIIHVNSADGYALIEIAAITSGVVTTTVIGISETSLQALSGAGAIDLLTKTTHHTSTGADAITLADGLFVGQVKKIILIVDGGTTVLTPANALGWTTLTSADAGDSCTLEWTAGGWVLIGQGGLTTGPLTA